MDKKLAALSCLIIVMVVSCLVFFTNKTIDFQTIIYATKIAVPAGVVGYVLGWLSGKVLQSSKGDTNLIHSKSQQQFVDDLLLDPDQVLLGPTFIKSHDEGDGSKDGNK